VLHLSARYKPFNFMDTYFTIEEKYLQAVEEATYDTAKGLQLLKQIIEIDPLYARAYFQLGKIYFYQVCDYQTAGFYFKTCMELEPAFPDNYSHFLSLVIFLNMEKQVTMVSEKALNTPGVEAAAIYDLLGLFFEKSKDWNTALRAYQKAFLEVTCKDRKGEIEESINRVKVKMTRTAAYQYYLTG